MNRKLIILMIYQANINTQKNDVAILTAYKIGILLLCSNQ